MPPSKTATKTPLKAKKAKSQPTKKLAAAAAGLKSEVAKPTRAKKPAQNPVKKPIAALPTNLQKPNHAAMMLEWFDREGRHLPWRHRTEPGGAGAAHPDPYHVFLSEIMLQQTTVATVIPYFNNFIKNYPTIKDLAAAPLDKILTAWAGLGYYARARNMHKAARQLVELYRGEWPQSEEKLRSLPGIGTYTAAAIAAIGFDQKAVVVDGNIERVVSRLFAVDELDSDAADNQIIKAASTAKLKKQIYDLAEILTPDRRPGDYAQAMMDLGASYCSPRQPLCGLCPIFRHCDGYLSGHPENYPRKKAKTVKPVRYGVAYWLKRGDGTVLLRRRVEKGLLGGMMEFPCTNFSEDEKIGFDLGAARATAPLTTAKWRKLEGRVTHIFTHFRLEIIVLAAEVRLADGNLGQWVKPDSFDEIALPTLFRKIASHALKQGG